MKVYDGRKPDIWDCGYVIVDFANGKRGMLELAMFAEGSDYQEMVHAVGPEGKLEVKLPALQAYGLALRLISARCRFLLKARAHPVRLLKLRARLMKRFWQRAIIMGPPIISIKNFCTSCAAQPVSRSRSMMAFGRCEWVWRPRSARTGKAITFDE